MTPDSIGRKVARRFIVLTVLLAVATILAMLAPLHWFAELFTHFTPHYCALALLFTGVFGLLRAWRWAAFALAIALWHGYPVAHALLHDESPAAPPLASLSQQFTIFHFNASLHHEDPRRITAHLRRTKDLDAVVLLEATDAFAAMLDDIKDIFPHQIRHLENSPFGIALASRHPIDFGAVSREPSGMFPHIEATIKLPGRAALLALYAVHAPPPISGDMAEWRNAKFTHIAAKARGQAALTPVVVGDFNLTPWSPWFRKFVSDSGLRDARTPRRFDHTWPVTFNNAHLGLAIDHSFAHPSLQLVKRAIGPDLGSDHMPVTVTFAY